MVRIVKRAVESLNQKKKIAKRLQKRINFNKIQRTGPIQAGFFIPLILKIKLYLLHQQVFQQRNRGKPFVTERQNQHHSLLQLP